MEEKITSLKVKQPNSFHVFNKEKGISGELNLYCALKEKNVVLNILKFIKYDYNEIIVYELLSVLFQQINTQQKTNHLESLNYIIFSLFSTIYDLDKLFKIVNKENSQIIG